MKLLLIGAGGHGKVVLDVARAAGFEEVAFLDDSASSPGLFCGVELLGRTGDLWNVAARGFHAFVVSIGDNRTRERFYDDALRCGLHPAILLHPTAVVSPSARIGGGTVVMPRAVINANAAIGCNCIINTASVTEHDCFVEDHTHVSPCAALAGGVRVGKSAHVGLGAVVLPQVEISAGAKVGAGAVVVRNVAKGVTVVGVPARPLQTK